MIRLRHCLLATLLAIALWACSGSDAQSCRIGADCPSGACAADGRCVPVDGSGGSSSASGGSTMVGGSAGSTSSAGSSSSAGGSGACLPDGDGTITQAEVPLMAGLSAKFLTALDVTVSTAGVAQGDGSRVWDFRGALSGDHLALVQTVALSGQWYAPSFPGASYVSRLSDAEELLGVFEIVPGALLLHGVVSPVDGITRTELSYSPPVMVLDFPLTESKSWQTSSTVSGLAQGVAVLYTEEYSYQVDAHGTVQTPYADFDTLRVHQTLVRTIGIVPTTIQSHVWVTECFGPIANARSQDHELATEFSDVAEIGRLSP
jgi:hypothetical protein